MYEAEITVRRKAKSRELGILHDVDVFIDLSWLKASF